MASELSVVASSSLLNRRHFPSQAKVRSTIHRFGRVTQPLASLGRRTISSAHPPSLSAHASSPPAYRPSAQIRCNRAVFPSRGVSTNFPGAGSWMSAACTTKLWIRPRVSTKRWRLRPLVFLPAS